MRIGDGDQSTLVLTKPDLGVAGIAAAAVGGATYLGLNTKTNVAAILAFTAAIFVALLTAYWTQRRLSQELSAAGTRLTKQLAAETKRQGQQLAAEQKRIQWQLAHDRDQQARMLRHERQRDDLREVRSVLDDAAKALARADDSRRDFIGDYGNSDKRKAVGEAGKGLDEMRGRLAIRFGREHVVTTSFEKSATALLDLFGATMFEDDIDPDRVKSANDDFEQAWGAWVDAATLRVGVELDPPS